MHLQCQRNPTSALGDEDLYGGGHGVGWLAGVVARVGGRGLLDVEPRLRLVRPVRGEDGDAPTAVVVHHPIVVVPEHVPVVGSRYMNRYIQGISIRLFPGLVNFVPAVAYLFCLLPQLACSILATWDYGLIEIPCTIVYGGSRIRSGTTSVS